MFDRFFVDSSFVSGRGESKHNANAQLHTWLKDGNDNSNIRFFSWWWDHGSPPISNWYFQVQSAGLSQWAPPISNGYFWMQHEEWFPWTPPISDEYCWLQHVDASQKVRGHRYGSIRGYHVSRSSSEINPGKFRSIRRSWIYPLAPNRRLIRPRFIRKHSRARSWWV